MGAGIMTPPLEPSSPIDGGIRKRVCKACDRCRLKKSKCDGSSPCSRCKADNAICVFGERKKSHDKVYPKGYVEMLESQQSQLVAGLQELYRRLQQGEGWAGSPLKETTRGTPLTHDILERLGALKQDGHLSPEGFEENLESLQQRLIAGGAGFMQREQSSDASSDIDQSPSFEHVTHHKVPNFTNPFPTNRFPPTPPSGSPHPQYNKTISPLKTQQPVTASHIQSNLAWQQDMSEFSDSMDFNMTYDSPINDPTMDMMAFASNMYVDQTGLGINPCLTVKEWPGMDDQMQRYFNQNLLA